MQASHEIIDHASEVRLRIRAASMPELLAVHLYYITRFGFRPSKVAYLPHYAWGDRERGTCPPSRSGLAFSFIVSSS
jgi:hypothetical protein